MLQPRSAHRRAMNRGAVTIITTISCAAACTLEFEHTVKLDKSESNKINKQNKITIIIVAVTIITIKSAVA